MNPAQFLLADGRQSGIWYCTTCMKTKVSMNREMAERCCVPIDCDYCGKPIEKDAGHYTTTHTGCSHLRQSERSAAAIEKAEKLDAWDGWVYLDGAGYRDGYFESVDDLIEHLIGDEDETDPSAWPEWVFTCKASPLIAIDSEGIIENECEDGPEDWDADSLKGVKEFDAACKAFNEANKDQLVYHEDRKRVARMPERSTVTA